jgi:hypothetical protein
LVRPPKVLIRIFSSYFLPRVPLDKVWEVLVKPNKFYALDLGAMGGSAGFLAMEATGGKMELIENGSMVFQIYFWKLFYITLATYLPSFRKIYSL